MERSTLNWRQFLGAVNLRDFSGMVLAELALIGMSVRVALRSFLHLPVGPLSFLALLLLAVLRLVVLVLAVVVLGTAVLLTITVRRALALFRSLTVGP